MGSDVRAISISKTVLFYILSALNLKSSSNPLTLGFESETHRSTSLVETQHRAALTYRDLISTGSFQGATRERETLLYKRLAIFLRVLGF